ncbi:ABC-type Fe3+-hydroxamate transport system, substrate-binding protein [Flavobacteriaceae bacterium MAR_2010_188]|nr:ABC-type Fe3+-hydroxamate transport system, substrate-binding protein [Flavobacteriaceae bacterium MAR_2010_188]
MKVSDQLNRTFTLDKPPSRIISLVPSLTELLCDLGLESSLVGITKFCVHPEHLRKNIKVIGGTKKVNFEKIKNLEPDIIIANKEENTLEIIQGLSKVAPIHISDIGNVEDCCDLIEAYGKLFLKEIEAQDLNARIEEKVLNFQNSFKNKKVRSAAYFIWKNPWMVAASDTFIDYMLSLNSFSNIYSNKTRYPEVELKSMPKDLDFIFLSSEPYPFSNDEVIELGILFPKTKVILVDGEMFSWYGSRILKAIDYFENLNKELDKLS